MPISEIAIEPANAYPGEPTMTETRMPVDHPLNCRCNKCRRDED